MSIKEELEEVIASVLYAQAISAQAISEEGLVEKLADSIIMNFTLGPDYLFKEQ